MRLSPEPRWETRSETLKDPAARAVEAILKHGQSDKPRLDDFKDVFRPEEIAIDKQRVKDLEREQAEKLRRLDPEERERDAQTHRRAEALEVFLDYQTEQNNWLGEGTYVVKTTEYDDRVNGMDMVAELEASENIEHVALALDASMNRAFSGVAEKVERNIAKITGELPPAKVKYFESQRTGYKGPLANVIPVVVGIEGKNADPLLISFAEIIELRQKKDKTPADRTRLKAKMEAMRTHPVQMALLEEIETQLELYAGLLAKPGKKLRPEMKEEVEKLQSLIHYILDTKKEIPLGKWAEDGVLGSIREVAKTTPALSRMRPH